MMVTVVDEGTGEDLRLTATMWPARPAPPARDRGGRLRGDIYMSSFLGFAPASDPEALCYVTLDGTPRGSNAACEPFVPIMSKALSVLGVRARASCAAGEDAPGRPGCILWGSAPAATEHRACTTRARASGTMGGCREGPLSQGVFMVEIAVKYIESVTGARGVAGNGERLCRGVFIDSRLVEPDGIFVAFAGERVDGNDYAERALEAGGGAVVLTREPTEDERAVATRHGRRSLWPTTPRSFSCAGPGLSCAPALDGHRGDGLHRQDHHQGHPCRHAL